MKASRLVILIVLAATLSAMLVFPPAVAAAPASPILVLNSYHQGYSWTDGEVAGIRSVLGDASTVQLSVEYLDWRRFPTQQNHDQVEKLLQTRYSSNRPDVLIVTDNPALDFALDHRSSLFAEVPIVFCGINDYQASVLRKDKNITGVAEEIDPAGTLAIALRLQCTRNQRLCHHGLHGDRPCRSSNDPERHPGVRGPRLVHVLS